MTFYWYDYETFGSNASVDRPAQFAGVRTGEDLEEIEAPLVLYCRPPIDYLPDPEACLIHGITPIRLLKDGVRESEFAHRILQELARPETCSVGYNAIGFDHEVTRFLLYRNLRDPYAWHWKNGNSRWDLIDLLRAAYALRPDGLVWPSREDGSPSFRLEDLAAANGLYHESPHEALADVRTTIALARLVRSRQPALFDYYLRLRQKESVAEILSGPCLLVSSFIAASRGCASVVMPICTHPNNENAVIVYDLQFDPSPYLEMHPDELRERLFTRRENGVPRPPLSTIKTNACPFVAPVGVVDDEVKARLCIDPDECIRHYRLIGAAPQFAGTVADAYRRDFNDAQIDVDAALYAGEFIPDDDRAFLDDLLDTDPTCARAVDRRFKDERLSELVFRYRARNYPETLTEEERVRWRDHCRACYLSPDADGVAPLDAYSARIDELRRLHADSPAHLHLLSELDEYGRKLLAWLV